MTALLWQHFGDEAVVFNPLSWETHVVNAATARVLSLLAEHADAGAPEEAQIRAWLAEAGTPPVDLDALLDLLRDLGLARCASA